MSFQKMDISNKDVEEGRSCIIICNFNGKQLQGVKNFASILGIRDQIVISNKNGESKIEDILKDKIEETTVDGVKERAIVFNNISHAKINMFIENLKKIKITNVLMAVVTEISKEWSVNILLTNLIEERRAMSSGKTLEHKL